jgi:glycosyltransferase involved in cell wall biosynthesis
VKYFNNPKVSVIMGAFNTSRYIDECIQSVLGQTFQDFEFIIINDGSTDDTLKIIKKYKDKRIKIIDNKKNLGVSNSLNKGLKISKGKYIAIMDSDDIMLPERLKITYEYLEKNKDIFLVGGAIYFIDDKGKILGKNVPVSGFENIKKRLKTKNCFWHLTIMFRNDAKNRYREKFRYAQDYDFITLIVTRRKKVNNIDQILTKYRIHNSSTSYSKRTKQDMFVNKIAEFYNQRLRTGKDDYDKFDVGSIMNFDVEKSTDKKILITESKARWESKDYAEARKFSGRYIKNYGISSKQTIYYLASYAPEFIIQLIRKIRKIFS